MRVLVVTGSRALVQDSGATERAQKRLEHEIFALGEDDLVITGDAQGPDSWALAKAIRARKPWMIYKLNGIWRASNSDQGAWATPEKIAAESGFRNWPLKRNEAMLVRAFELAAKGHKVRLLALVANWSTTGGTAHTMKLAKMAKLPVAVAKFDKETS